MRDDRTPRFTIDQVDFRQAIQEWRPRLADRGRRRHLSYTFDFDTRAVLLEQELAQGWSDEVARLHVESREKIVRGLAGQFGERILKRCSTSWTLYYRRIRALGRTR